MKKLKKMLYAFLNPQCLRGVGIYLSSSKQSHWHRELALNIHPKLSRSSWYIILFISTICWYFAIFWLQLIHSLFIAFKQKEFKLNLISDLLYIGLWIGASPYNYFSLNLINAKKPDWIFYVFLEEQITWYSLFNLSSQQGKNNQGDISILNDKQTFSEYLLNNAIPAIPTIDTFTQESKNHPQLIEEKINQLIKNDINIFIKPQSNNAMKGCIWVTTNYQTEDCTAFGFNHNGQFIKIMTKQELVKFILSSLENLAKKTNLPTSKSNLLIQKNYHNNKQISSILNTSLPVSLRIITYQQLGIHKKILLAYAFLEEYIEGKNNKIRWQIHNIDISTGKVNNQKIKNWPTMTNQVIKAHSMFPAIYTIAWDTILTEEGLKIIEGNFGWDTVNPQRASNYPLLKVIT